MCGAAEMMLTADVLGSRVITQSPQGQSYLMPAAPAWIVSYMVTLP